MINCNRKAEKLPENKKKAPKPHWIDSTYNTAEWLITAFAVTLVFLVFAMQAYTIPTGSMADTLKGAHFRLRCEQCGYRYDHGYSAESRGRPANIAPSVNEPIAPAVPRCPSCGYYRITAIAQYDPATKKNVAVIPPGQTAPVVKGDRIFVTKCIYQFLDPKRWDVIVFKNPIEPRINYIKRLIALPGETVQIIDGDIYIKGEGEEAAKIARKPAHLQDELWMPIFDNDYQPIMPEGMKLVNGMIAKDRFNGHAWSQPFENIDGGEWNLDAKGPTVFSLDSEDVQTITYNTKIGNDFRAACAYDESRQFPAMPICSDLKIGFDAQASGEGDLVGATLSKYGKQFKGYVRNGKSLVIELLQDDGNFVELDAKQLGLASKGRFEFSNVDHVLTVKFAGEELVVDLNETDVDMQYRTQMPTVSIFGKGKLELQHIAIFRDIHYLTQMGAGVNARKILRAGPDTPLELKEDQFFALGDNSPASLDGRLWPIQGIGNAGKKYDAGIVPRDYLVGKAFCVYWPGGSKFSDKSKIRLVPYIGGLKLIYGGELNSNFLSN